MSEIFHIEDDADEKKEDVEDTSGMRRYFIPLNICIYNINYLIIHELWKFVLYISQFFRIKRLRVFTESPSPAHSADCEYDSFITFLAPACETFRSTIQRL